LLTSAVLKIFSQTIDIVGVDVNEKRLNILNYFVNILNSDNDTFKNIEIYNPLSTKNISNSTKQNLKFDTCIEVSGNMRGLQTAIDNTINDGKIIIGSWYKRNKNLDDYDSNDYENNEKKTFSFFGKQKIKKLPNKDKENFCLNLDTKFHRSSIQLIASQVSKIPSNLSSKWTKSRRFELVWNIIKILKPSKLLLIDNRDNIKEENFDKLINLYNKNNNNIDGKVTNNEVEEAIFTYGSVNMNKQKKVLKVFNKLKNGELLTALLSNNNNLNNY
jgi:hypothetical protein